MTGGRDPLQATDRRVAADIQIATRVAQIDPGLDATGLVDQIGALLSDQRVDGTSPRLLVALSIALGVERGYLTDLEVADRSDCAEIAAALAASGLRGQVRICRTTGSPGVAEIMMEILDAIAEHTGGIPFTPG